MENDRGGRSLSLSFRLESTTGGSRIPRLAEFARIKTNSSGLKSPKAGWSIRLSHSKVVFSIGQNTFKEKLGSDFLKVANINPALLKDKDLEIFKEATNTAMFRGGAASADAITFGAEKIEKKLVDEFGKVKGKKVLAYNAESDLTDYLQLYTDLSK